jgi:hypothetical protein
LLPAGQNVEVGLDEAFSAETQYFGALLVGSDPAVVESIIDRQWVRSRQASETDPLVKKGLLKKRPHDYQSTDTGPNVLANVTVP